MWMRIGCVIVWMISAQAVSANGKLTSWVPPAQLMMSEQAQTPQVGAAKVSQSRLASLFSTRPVDNKGAEVKSPMVSILRIDQFRNNQSVSRLELLSNNIDPNSRSIDDRYEMRLNGRLVAVPSEFMEQLTSLRRSVSYDTHTKGIQSNKQRVMCKLGGHSQGLVLSTRYLTYQKYRIVSDAMKPIYSVAGNCLFNQHVAPINEQSKLTAARMMGMMDVLMRMHSK